MVAGSSRDRDCGGKWQWGQVAEGAWHVMTRNKGEKGQKNKKQVSGPLSVATAFPTTAVGRMNLR